jgi:hypothetical protein
MTDSELGWFGSDFPRCKGMLLGFFRHLEPAWNFGPALCHARTGLAALILPMPVAAALQPTLLYGLIPTAEAV